MPKASHHDLRFAFRELLASGSCYHTASVFDPMSARIAADLGFATPSHFGELFLHRFGVTPGEYRRAGRRRTS